jgi:hypothetical protein
MKCAFCNRDAVTKGGEHIWDNWINEEIPKTRFNAKKRLSLDSRPIQFVSNGLNEKLPAVCSECNSGWMSAVTAQVKDRFSGAMLHGEPFSLGLKDAELLAAFTFMKAIIQDYCYSEIPFFKRVDRRTLRTSLKVPDFVGFWCSAYQGSSRLAFRSYYDITCSRPPFAGAEFFSFTYICGKLALQLVAPGWKDISDNRPLLILKPNSYWDPAATKFWPHPRYDLSWPPDKYLGDDVIEQFVNRFAVPINL